MSSYTYSSFTTTRSLTYSYIHIPPSHPQTQYILFLHGFPSGSHDWHFQIDHFTAKGYGVIVPDLLGYGDTSKPLDFNLYSGKGMVSDIAELLEHEGIEKVVGVAHDWFVLPVSKRAPVLKHILKRFPVSKSFVSKCLPLSKWSSG